MKNYESTVTIFLFAFLIIISVMGGYGLYKKAQCKTIAISQNYSADSIKKICQ